MSRLPGSLLKKSVNAAILSFLLLPVLMLLTLAGCGSGSTTSPTSADYTLSATPATVSLAPGGSATMSVLASAAGSFTGTVSVAVSGLPTGVTANPSALTLTPGTAQTITLKAASTTVAGSATVTLTGTAGTLVHTAATTLTVTAPVPVPDFSLTIAPAKINVLAGSTISQPVTVSVAPINGFSGSVSVNITGLPAGVTASPNTLTLKPGTPQIIQLLAASSATASSSTLTFTGTSGTLSHTATLALSVAVAQPDFSLAVTPTTQSVTINGATGSTVTVSATAINGFSSPVAVALTGLPAGVTATPSSLTLTPGQPQNISLAATSTATAGPRHFSSPEPRARLCIRRPSLSPSPQPPSPTSRLTTTTTPGRVRTRRKPFSIRRTLTPLRSARPASTQPTEASTRSRSSPPTSRSMPLPLKIWST